LGVGFFVSFSFTENVSADAIAEREAQLRAELAKTEAEIAQWSTVLNAKRQETASISRDAAILAAKVEQAKLVIKAKNLTIQTLGKDITEKEETIEQLNARIARGKNSLAELLRKSNEIDNYSVAEVVLSNKNVSDFFLDLDSYDTIKRSLDNLFNEIRETKNLTEAEKATLAKKQIQETDAKVAVEAEKRSVEKTEAEKRELIRINQTQEKSYEQVLRERERRAAEIRSALFALRDTAAIPFGTALTYANEMSKKTGVRPAFILAILTQESDLGRNVGQCLVKNMQNGDGVGKNTGTPFSGIMHPTRDVPVFVALSERLGFDPKSQPVSCPQPGGYGGAMGPSQFIPSTWIMYESRVASHVGVPVPNPWEPRHAFAATGIFLADLGASRGGYSAEREAAARYYAGGGWATRGLGYADSVLAHATRIQETMIDPLQGL
jgi:membrane-bound lytic murein transglycosylase B